MPNTTNFNWATPADTDLVKDGAAAIRTLGSSIDTSLVDLKGGTTGQILSKTSNTDLDYTWINNDQGDITAVTAGTGISGGGSSGAVTITNSMATEIDAKGDLIGGTGADTFARLAVGANGTVLTADSVETTGLKWVAPASPSKNYTLLSTTTLSGATSVTISGISSADSILITFRDVSSVNAGSQIRCQFNSDTGSNYNRFGICILTASTYSAGNTFGVTGSQTFFELGTMNNAATDYVAASLIMNGANTSGIKPVSITGAAQFAGGDSARAFAYQGLYSGSSTISSLTVISSTGNFDGTSEIKIYTSA